MPTPPKRIIYFIIVCVLFTLSAYSFIDSYLTFGFLLNDLPRNLGENVVILMIFSFFLSFTGFVSVIYTARLMRNDQQHQNTTLIDDAELRVQTLGWKYYVHLQFCGLIILLGLFLLIFPIQEEYPISKFPEGFGVYFLVAVIIGLGVLLLRDGIQLKREIEPNK
jgi:hypothetical protein